MKCPSRNGGFTLVELLAVLFLLSITIAIAGISIGKAMDKARIKDEAIRLRSTMRHARDRSMVERMPYIVIVNSSDGAYAMTRADKRDAAMHALPKGLRIEEGGEVVFWPKGNSTGGSFTIADEKQRRYRVDVEPSTGASKLSGL